MITKKTNNASEITPKFVAKASGLSIPSATARIKKYRDGLITYEQMLAPRGKSGFVFTKNNRINKKQPKEINFRGTLYKKNSRGIFYKGCADEWIKAKLDKSSLRELENDFRIAAMRGSFA